MPLDPAAITASFFAVLKSDAAGAAVRDILGAQAASVVMADDLKLASLPRPPFLALRPGPITGARYQVRTCFFTWWVYDEAALRFTRINAVLPLIEAAYTAHVIPYGRTDLAGGISQEIPRDRALERPTRSITLTYTTRR
jgi:hypothetical protein